MKKNDVPQTKSECLKELDKLNEDYLSFSGKFSKSIYICQTISILCFALAIPEAWMKKEFVFMLILIVGVISLIWPFIDACFKNEFRKQKKELEEKIASFDSEENISSEDV